MNWKRHEDDERVNLFKRLDMSPRVREQT